jgi:hypothetical protein
LSDFEIAARFGIKSGKYYFYKNGEIYSE